MNGLWGIIIVLLCYNEYIFPNVIHDDFDEAMLLAGYKYETPIWVGLGLIGLCGFHPQGLYNEL